MCNIKFTMCCIGAICIMNITMWLCVLLLNTSGDIHPNPGPSISSVSTYDSSIDMSSIISSPNSLSLIHYNVQSLLPKLDLLVAELSSFDILTFSETWLSATITNDQLSIPGYCQPIRRDRQHNSYGGVIVYVKEGICCVRRPDLEIHTVESIWLEIKFRCNKRMLVGVFYRPPNSDINYFNKIEDSIGLAKDTGINDIVITGDFNLNSLCFLCIGIPVNFRSLFINTLKER